MKLAISATMEAYMRRESAIDADTLAWILRACQEYEQCCAEWQHVTNELEREKMQLTDELHLLDRKKKHVLESRDILISTISAQRDLIGSLNRDIAGSPEESFHPKPVPTVEVDHAPATAYTPERVTHFHPASPSQSYTTAPP